MPAHDDRRLFEMLLLEGAQAGLSWLTILRKRPNYRRAFDRFDPRKIARYDTHKVRALLAERGHRAQPPSESARVHLANAHTYLEVVDEFGSFNEFISRTELGGAPRVNRWRTSRQVPARTAKSDAMSKDLRRRGFTFVGSTICYAYMQATGMVNDHLVSCFHHREVGRKA